ncbi:MAG: DUF115 domain-containing protein [Spirochaetaceae bacterium]|jgi:hypothetical protein|nr:DUF115 domain-containing protein [Spirochaetaceae bacterium]
MEETLVRSQCGLDTVLIGRKTIHSRYNPLTEAERYIVSLNLKANIQYIILVECGLCYLILPLRKKFPGAKIISLHASAFYRGKSAAPPDAEWLPGSPLNRGLFLENEIDDTESDKIKIIEWRPAADVYGEKYLNLIKDITTFVKRVDANKRTRSAFGRRWVKNVIKNCFLFNSATGMTLLTHCDSDCIVAGAGPGLENAYGAIRRLVKGGALLIAVSSAVSALFHAGLRPDIIVACDGGNWALLHLFEVVRLFSKKGGRDVLPSPALAFNLSAALPSWCNVFNLLPFSDGTLFQNLVQKCFDMPPLSFPQRGTVGASALDLAFYVSGGTIYTAGIDFSHNDIRTHAKPYAFDKILFGTSNRMRPFYSLQFERAEMINSSGANRIYAEWFAAQNYRRKVYSVTDYTVIAGSGGGKNSVVKHFKKSSVKNPVTRLITVLINALGSPEAGGKLTEELSGLLLNGPPAAGSSLQKELLRIGLKYRAME